MPPRTNGSTEPEDAEDFVRDWEEDEADYISRNEADDYRHEDDDFGGEADDE